MITLIIIGVFLFLALISRTSRLELLKPEHSTWKIFVYLGVYQAFDMVIGLPLKGLSNLETFGIVALGCMILCPFVMAGEHYSRKWWKVSER